MKSEETIFSEALSITSEWERANFIADACGDDVDLRRGVEALLAAHQEQSGVLELPPAGVDTLAVACGLDGGTSKEVGTLVGHYKLLQQIGEGGMGVVFMAEQTQPVRRRVAVKIIKPGMDTKQVIARFEAERQALAMMDHPNIAKVLDAGATDAGRPYFVMELVKGVPITEYCDQQQLGPRERLALFIQACKAVQHAHTKGVIHRDLKPTNVLVTLNDGHPAPKIIDFGIAKAIAGQRLTDQTLFTEFRQLVGTPLYMSPEQAEMSTLMDVDTRTDVYSLGVLLYELLTGTTPFDKQRLAKAAFEEVRRILREEEPPRLSTRLSTLGETLATISASRSSDPKRLGQLMRGELDWIAMKALEKDRDRRYGTPSDLARDVERYLADQPVEACPPTRFYRFRTMVRRNKAAISTVGVLGIVLLLATAVSTWQAIRASRATAAAKIDRDQAVAEKGRAVTEQLKAVAEKKRADEQAALTHAVNGFVEDMLGAADPERLLGDKVTVLQVTEQALKRLDEGALKDSPLVEASVRHTIGLTLCGLSRFGEAEALFRKALATRRPLQHGNDVARELAAVAVALREQGRLKEADPLLVEAIEISRKQEPPDDREIALNLDNLGLNLEEQGKLSEAEPLLRDALAIARKCWPKEQLGAPINNYAILLMNQEKLTEAEILLRESLAINRKWFPSMDPTTAICLSNLGQVLVSQNKLGEAEPLIREALDIHRKVFPPGHPRIEIGAHNLGNLLQRQGRLSEAEQYLREALTISRKHDNPLRLLVDLNDLAIVLRDLGNLPESESLAREALKIRRAHWPAKHRDVATGLETLAGVLRWEGKLADAESLLVEALEINRQVLPAGHTDLALTLNTLGLVLTEEHRPDAAEPLLREALKIYHDALPPDHPFIATTLSNLGLALSAGHKLAQAESAFREALAIQRKSVPPGHPDTAFNLEKLGGLVWDQGNGKEGEPLMREALDIYRKSLPAGHVDIVRCMETLGTKLMTHKSYDRAEPLLISAYEQLRLAQPPATANQLADEIFMVRSLYVLWGKPQEAGVWRAKLEAADASAKTDGKPPRPTSQPK